MDRVSSDRGRGEPDSLSPLEFHVLLALAGGPLHGYAVAEAVAAESAGALTPRAGSLYRVVARLVTARLVAEAEPPGVLPSHPGLARRYYALTATGRQLLAAEAARLRRSAAVAEERLGLLRSSP
jgi:DNA-binding PadR family transcriptional regulator